MDPLSITTGVVTLLAACSATARTFKRILSLKDAPPLIQALNNEISDLQLAVMDVDEYVQQIKTSRASTPIADARILRMCFLTLNDAREKIQAIDTLLHTRILKPSVGSKFEIKYPSLVSEFGRLSQLQTDIRHSRQRITHVLGHIGMKKTSAIEVLIRDAQIVNTEFNAEMIHRMRALTHGQAQIEGNLESIMKSQSIPSNTISNSLLLRRQNLPAATSASRGIDIPVARMGHTRPKHHCSCRQEGSLRYMQSCFGTLFIGYAASPVLDRHQQLCPCKPEIDLIITYVFPLWFFCNVFLFRVQYSRLEQITFSLSFRQILPENHIVYSVLDIGGADDMKKLLSSGQISFRAQTSNGTGLLYQAVAHVNLSVAEFLLKLGADPNENADSSRSPYKRIWQSIFSRGQTAEWNQKAQSLFPPPDFDELFGFSPLHKAVLSLEDYRIESQISDEPAIVDAEDQGGRTPLSWAASVGNAEAVRILLAHGAECNQADKIGKTPIMHAAGRSKLIVDTLLRNNADVLARDEFQDTALHYAATAHQPLAMVESLVNAGAVINAQSTNGQTPLHCALTESSQYGSLANYLIDHGADAAIQDNTGCNALCYAAQHNSHSVIELILSKGADHIGPLVAAGTFMHMAAESADVKTLRLLTHGHLQRRNINIKNNRGLTPFQVGMQREDTDAEWKVAFVDFLKALDKDQPLSNECSEGAEEVTESAGDDGIDTDDFGLRQLFGDLGEGQ